MADIPLYAGHPRLAMYGNKQTEFKIIMTIITEIIMVMVVLNNLTSSILSFAIPFSLRKASLSLTLSS